MRPKIQPFFLVAKLFTNVFGHTVRVTVRGTDRATPGGDPVRLKSWSRQLVGGAGRPGLIGGTSTLRRLDWPGCWAGCIAGWLSWLGRRGWPGWLGWPRLLAELAGLDQRAHRAIRRPWVAASPVRLACLAGPADQTGPTALLGRLAALLIQPGWRGWVGMAS